MIDAGMTLVTPPTQEPVSQVEAKANLRVEVDLDDPLIDGLIAAARAHLEESLLHRQLCTATRRMYLDAFPAEIRLLRPPLQSVTSVEYIDTAGNLQTLAADQYQVSAGREPAVIRPAYGCSWPSTRSEMEAVRVTYVCGYGGPEDVPRPIRQWLLAAVGMLYSERSLVITGTIMTRMTPLDGLLAGYKLGTLCFGGVG